MNSKLLGTEKPIMIIETKNTYRETLVSKKVLISIKYPDKNNTNEVEIVDILEEE